MSRQRNKKPLTAEQLHQRYSYYLSQMPAVKHVEGDERFEGYTGLPYIYERKNDVVTIFKMIEGKVTEVFTFQPHAVTYLIDSIINGYAYAEKIKTAEAITQANQSTNSSGDGESDGVQSEENEMEESVGE